MPEAVHHLTTAEQVLHAYLLLGGIILKPLTTASISTTLVTAGSHIHFSRNNLPLKSSVAQLMLVNAPALSHLKDFSLFQGQAAFAITELAHRRVFTVPVSCTTCVYVLTEMKWGEIWFALMLYSHQPFWSPCLFTRTEKFPSSWLTLLTWARGVLAPLTGIRPRLLSSNSLPGDLSLRVLRSRPGDFSLSSGRPGDLSLRSSVLPSRYRCGVLGSRGWLGPSGGPGLDATRLVMCSLYVGGPLLLGLLSFKNNGREQLSDKNLTLNFLLAKIKLYPNSQQCLCEKSSDLPRPSWKVQRSFDGWAFLTLVTLVGCLNKLLIARHPCSFKRKGLLI